MKVTMKKVTKNLADYDRVKELYDSSFPADEKAPFYILMKKAAKKNVDFRCVYINDEFAGIFYAVKENDLVYLFYLAVDGEKRGRGCGSVILKAFKKKYEGDRIFLALEQLDENAPNYGERLARKRFYEKNGFSHMLLTIREGKVVYDVMGIGGDIRPEEYKTMMKNYMGFLLSSLVSMDTVCVD